MADKVKSVLELSPYKVGDVLYWINIQPIDHELDVSDEDAWMFENCVHPKTFYERLKPKSWRLDESVPRLHAHDFNNVMSLLCSLPMIDKFEITDLTRDQNTGEYIYKDARDHWMPQSCLFETEKEAEIERARVLLMVQQWAHQGGYL